MSRRVREGAAIVMCAGLVACGAGGDGAAVVDRGIGQYEASTRVAAAPSPASDRGPLLVVLGDSLTAGLGVEIEQAYPSVLGRQLLAEGHDLRVVNAGVSGDTTASGLRRAEWALEGDVRILIVALGGNDGLRGLPVEQMKQNLAEIVSMARSRGIAVLLAGMEAPPNFGATYTAQFRTVFQELAREHDVTFMPFLLDGVAGDPDLNQADGIHPNAAGAAIVAERVREALEPLHSVLSPTHH
jgi:acyl-CoA thioesterase-1